LHQADGFFGAKLYLKTIISPLEIHLFIKITRYQSIVPKTLENHSKIRLIESEYYYPNKDFQ